MEIIIIKKLFLLCWQETCESYKEYENIKIKLVKDMQNHKHYKNVKMKTYNFNFVENLWYK